MCGMFEYHFMSNTTPQFISDNIMSKSLTNSINIDSNRSLMHFLMQFLMKLKEEN